MRPSNHVVRQQEVGTCPLCELPDSQIDVDWDMCLTCIKDYLYTMWKLPDSLRPHWVWVTILSGRGPLAKLKNGWK